MPQLHDHPLRKTYSASWCSCALLFHALTWAVLVVVPLALAYASQGFWIRENVYWEQPEVRFRHEAIVVASGRSAAGGALALAWTTSAQLNQALGDAYRPIAVETFADDTNADGTVDVVRLNFSLPLAQGEQLHRFTALLQFDLALRRNAAVEMDVLAVADASDALPGVSATLDGDLLLRQREPMRVVGGSHRLYSDQPLWPRDVAVDGNGGVPAFASLLASAPHVAPLHVLARYRERNLTAQYTVPYPVWIADPAPPAARRLDARAFHASITVRVPLQPILYRPQLGEVLKVAWIQYFAVAWVVFRALQAVRAYVYQHQLVETRVSVDSVVAQHRGRKLHAF